jgi:hypothetical protein
MKIVILDFTGTRVFVADYPRIDTDPEDFIDHLSSKHDLGMRSANCQYMIIPDSVTLNITHL